MARSKKSDKKIERTNDVGVVARPSLELCRELIEMASDWIWKLDKNLRCIYSNSKVADILGYTVDEIIGKRPFDLMDSEEAERIKTFLSLQKEKRPLLGFRIVHRHKNNSCVVTETNANPIFNERGEFDGYIGVNRDVTVRVNLEQSYQKAIEQYEELETIVNATSSIVVLWKNDKGGSVEYVSNNVLRLGYTCDEFYAKNFQFITLIHPDDRARITNEISLHG
jgi:PAS domain S-box-containing protein